jgi:hypothetical protein
MAASYARLANHSGPRLTHSGQSRLAEKLCLRRGLSEKREERDQEKWAPVFRPITRQTKKVDGRLEGRP